MAITPYNILRHEVIGLRAIVAESKSPGLTGLTGEIVDETAKTFTLKGREGLKKVPKEGTTLSIHTDSGDELLVNGSLFLGRPEERIKKKVRIAF